MVDTKAEEIRAVAARIRNLVVKAERLRLTFMGVDRAAANEILVNGTIMGLVHVFREVKIGNDEELVKALRECLRKFDNR
jgi:hypothetical protein